MMSVSEAAASLGVSERTIWRWLGSGRLASERVGRRVLVQVAGRSGGRAVAEAQAPYRASGDAAWGQPGPGPWPYTAENLEKRAAIRAAQRRRAAERMDELGLDTRPDPDGWTAVDYLRELRGPIGEDRDDSGTGTVG